MSAVEVKPKPITIRDFEKFDSEWRLDLIKGEVRPMPPPPGEEHGYVTNLLAVWAGYHVLMNSLGDCFAAETRFIIERNPDTAIGPDWAFIAKERLPEKRSKGFVPVVPDAVLEVRSPSDRPKEVREKVQRWLDAGVRLVWELNPAVRVLTVYRPDVAPQELGIEDTLTGGEVLPGFSLPLKRLFEKGNLPESGEDEHKKGFSA